MPTRMVSERGVCGIGCIGPVLVQTSPPLLTIMHLMEGPLPDWIVSKCDAQIESTMIV